MGYLLDTNIAIEIGNLNGPVVARYLPNSGQCSISALNLVELQRGVELVPELAAHRRERLAILLTILPVLSFDEEAAAAYGQIIAQIGWSRARDFDRMIAAHVISTQSVLVTNNEADFRDIPGLSIENWVT